MLTAAGMIGQWQDQTGGQLTAVERAFIDEVLEWGPVSYLWEEPGREFDRLAIEGPAAEPQLVCYFRSEGKRPELRMAFEWPFRAPDVDESDLGYSVWMANLGELLDEAGCALPREAGPDGIARTR